MRLSRRSMILVATIVVVIGAVVSGTLAYLTDTSSVTNTFTVGDVKIALDEAKVNAEGQPVDDNGAATELASAPRVSGNNYHLVPGLSYTKDPTMTVLAGSEPAYVRMRVTITDYSDLKAAFDKHGKEFLFAEFVADHDPDLWVFYSQTVTEEDTLVMEFRYNQAVDAKAAEQKLAPLFSGFTVPAFLDGDDLATLIDEDAATGETPVTINVVGDAIQQAGFADENAAWAAFDEQVQPVSSAAEVVVAE